MAWSHPPWVILALRVHSGDTLVFSGFGLVRFMFRLSVVWPAAVVLPLRPISIGDFMFLVPLSDSDVEDELRIWAFYMLLGDSGLPVQAVGFFARRGCPTRSSILWRLCWKALLMVAPETFIGLQWPILVGCSLWFRLLRLGSTLEMADEAWVSASRNCVVFTGLSFVLGSYCICIVLCSI